MKIQECKRSFIVEHCFHVEHAITKVLSEHYPAQQFDKLICDGAFYIYKDYEFCLKAIRASNNTYVIVEVILNVFDEENPF